MIITSSQTGGFSKTIRFLKNAEKVFDSGILDKYGEKGVEALARTTPVKTGKTANSWRYKVEVGPDQAAIKWFNSNINENVNVAVLIQYGHGTETGGYVSGIDYINPAMKPVFEEIAESISKEVRS